MLKKGVKNGGKKSEFLDLKVHQLAGGWVGESDAFGMKIKAVGGSTVEDVAFDGHSQSVGMGAVDAQLVGAPRFGVELDAAIPFINIVGDSWFSVAAIDRVAWGVEGVAQDGQGDDSFGRAMRGKWGLEDCHIFLLHLVLHKLLLQQLAAGQGFGSQDESGGVLVQAMYKADVGADGAEVGLERHFAVILAGYGEQTRWLIDHHEVIVFVDDAYLGQECFGSGKERIYLHIQSL